MKKVVFLILGLFLLLQGFAQQSDFVLLDLRNIPENPQPDSIVICETSDTVSLYLLTLQDTLLTNVVLTIKLPQGLEYAGYIDGVLDDGSSVSGVSTLDVLSDPQNITFNLPDLLDTIPFKLFFTLKGDCRLGNYISNGGLINIKYQIDYTDAKGVSRTYLFEPFKDYNNGVLIPKLNITSVLPSFPPVQVGQNYTKTIIVSQDGIGAFLSEFTFRDKYNPSAMRIDSIYVNGKYISFVIVGGNEIVINIDGNYFPVDSLLNEGEQVTIVEYWTYMECKSGSVFNRYFATYSCNFQPCEESEYIDGVTVPDVLHEMGFNMIYQQLPTLCSAGTVELTVTNLSIEPFVGFGVFKDVSFVVDYTCKGFSDPIKHTPSDFKLNGSNITPVLSTAIDTNYGYNYNYLTFSFKDLYTVDPDGPGGLEDNDGDGYYDDIAVGDSIKITYAEAFELPLNPIACGPIENCSQNALVFNYTTHCNEERKAIYSLDPPSKVGGAAVSLAYGTDINILGSDIEIEYTPGADVICPPFFCAPNVQALGSCTDSKSELFIVLPPGVTLVSSTWEGAPTTNAISGDTVFMIGGNSFDTELAKKFEFTIDNTAGSCGDYDNIPYSLSLICNELACSTKWNIKCGVLTLPQAPCPAGICPAEIVQMTVERTTFGWLDSTMSAVADKNTPGVLLNRVLPQDSVLFCTKAVVRDSLMDLKLRFFWNERYHPVYYKPPGCFSAICQILDHYPQTLEFVDGFIQVYDSSSSSYVAINCSSFTTNVAEFSYPPNTNQGYLMDFSSCLPPGFVLESGDSIITKFKMFVSDTLHGGETPLLPTDIVPQMAFGGNEPSGTETFCDPYAITLELTSGDLPFSSWKNCLRGCIVSAPSIMRTGVKDYATYDFFTNEYRPAFRIDSITVGGRKSFEFISPNPVAFYIKGLGNIFLSPDDSLTIINYNAFSGWYSNKSWVFRNPGNWPLVDQGEPGDLFRFTPEIRGRSCGGVGTSSNTVQYHTTKNFYITAFNNNPNDLRKGNNKNDTEEGTCIGKTFGGWLSMVVTAPILKQISGDIVEWEVIITNNRNSDSLLNWLTVESPSKQIEVIDIIDITSGGNEVVEDVSYLEPAYNIYNAKLGRIGANQTKVYKIRARIKSCDLDSVKFYSGWHCDWYPTDPRIAIFAQAPGPEVYNCTGFVVKAQGFVKPFKADIQMSAISEPATINFCDTLEYVFLMKGVDQARTYNLELFVYTPFNGGSILPGSFEVSYPDSLSYYAIPDFISTGNTTINGKEYKLDMSSINSTASANGFTGTLEPDSNTMYIKFRMLVDCDFAPNSVFNAVKMQALGTQVCPEPVISNLGSSGMPTVVTSPTNEYITILDPPVLYDCGIPQTLSILVINDGPDTTSSDEQICVNLPYQLPYIGGSAIPLIPLNWTLNTSQNNNGVNLGYKEICVQMPNGVLPNKLMIFNVDVDVPDTLGCDPISVILQTKYHESVSCAPAPSCIADIVTNIGEEATIQKLPSLRLDDINGSAALGGLTGVCTDSSGTLLNTINLNFTYTNKGRDLSAGTKLKIRIYQDKNFDGKVDANDILLHVDSLTTALLKGQSETSTINFEVTDDADLCNLIFELETETGCSCNSIFSTIGDLPLKVFKNPKSFTFCVSGTTLFKSVPATDLLICSEYANSNVSVFTDTMLLIAGTAPFYTCTSPFFCPPTLAINYNSGSLSIQVRNDNPIEFATYQVVFSFVNNATGCTFYDTLILSFVPNNIDEAIAMASSDTICVGGCTNLTASLKDLFGDPIIDSAFLQGLNVTWSPDLYLNDNTSATPIACPISDMQYIATIVMTDGVDTCAILKDTVDIVTVSTNPTYSLSLPVDDSICLGAGCYGPIDARALINPYDANATYSWTPASSVSPSATLYATNLCPGASTNYSLSVRYPDGCTIDDDFYLFVESAIVDLGQDTFICSFETITIDAFNPNTISYIWITGDSTSSITISDTGVYSVVVVNNKQCLGSDKIVIDPCRLIYIPNAFSPNRDGENDFFRIRGEGFNNLFIKVYDRWGKRVFDAKDNNSGWDGNYKGKPVASGVYVYVITGSFVDGTEINLKGNITLVK